MADIFQQEIGSPEEQEQSDEQDLEAETEEPKIEEPSDESEDKSTKANNELEVDLEIDNLYYFQTQTVPTFEELATSDYIHNRQVAAKKILESLQKAGSNQDELQSIISVMCKLSEDEESIVRSELVQHIPSIALFCQAHPSGLGLVIQQQLVPYTVKLLNDPQIAVRKLAQSALLVLLENNLIGLLQLSEWICPLISQLAMCESNLEEQRIEDVTVMSMMIPLVPRAMAIKFFLEPYISLCCDPAFGIRTVCAMRFGTLCKIAGTETTELSLLPSFLNLCCDDLWGVRKACADVFVDVANVVSLKTRKEVLPHIFINLLNDPSRYVENAALQSLGGFISSFADPLKTGCSYKDGKIHVDESFYKTASNDKNDSVPPRKKTPPKAYPTITDNHYNLTSNEPFSNPEDQTGDSTPWFKYMSDPKPIHKKSPPIITEIADKHASEPFSDPEHQTGDLSATPNPSTAEESRTTSHTAASGPLSVVGKAGLTHLHVDNMMFNNNDKESGSFNTFQFWRPPIPDVPEVELDIDLEGGQATEIHVRARAGSGTSEIVVRISPDPADSGGKRDGGMSHVQVHSACVNTFAIESGDASDVQSLDAVTSTCQSKLLTFSNKKLVQVQETLNDASVLSDRSFFYATSESSEEEECFESLTPDDQDVVPAQLLSKYTAIVDHYLDKAVEFCAYSFPAVAFTLGRKYWPCIRATCKKIASNVKWSVRLPIASSLHDLARIVGPDATVRDLLPIFVEYLGDEDEVKMRLLQHLPQFLEQLSCVKRCHFLNSLSDFVRVYDRNWRFRCAVAEQFQPTSLLFSTYEVYEHFLPVALDLLRDRVFSVRVKGTEFMAHIIKLMYKDEKTEKHCETLLLDLVTTYRTGTKWISRQTFVFLCDQLAKKKSLPLEVYEEKVLPHLFHLARDSVPNVRLAVARCLVTTLGRRKDYLESLKHFRNMQLLSTVEFLVEDNDADVRHIACLWYQFQRGQKYKFLIN